MSRLELAMLNARGRAANACSCESIATISFSVSQASMIAILEADMYREASDSNQSEPYPLITLPDTIAHRFQLEQGNSIKVLVRKTDGPQITHELASRSTFVSCSVSEETQATVKTSRI